MGRVPIGGTDFSTRPYTYDDDVDSGVDANLTKFALQPEDFKFKVNICAIFIPGSFAFLNTEKIISNGRLFFRWEIISNWFVQYPFLLSLAFTLCAYTFIREVKLSRDLTPVNFVVVTK